MGSLDLRLVSPFGERLSVCVCVDSAKKPPAILNRRPCGASGEFARDRLKQIRFQRQTWSSVATTALFLHHRTVPAKPCRHGTLSWGRVRAAGRFRKPSIPRVVFLAVGCSLFAYLLVRLGPSQIL